MEPVTLTDHEIEALNDDSSCNLADGHASQELPVMLTDVLLELPELWQQCTYTPSPRIEHDFHRAFAQLAKSPTMARLPSKVCPTASNSADIVATTLQECGLKTRLIEPAFDNLHLLSRRRGVALESMSERELFEAAHAGTLTSFLDRRRCDALFIVQPNNPTGFVLRESDFRIIAEHCADRKTVLVLDNSFRFYKREPFDDYAILLDAGVSFLSFEDTGKVFPTNDDKASLLFCSPDLAGIATAIYNELFLRTSPFTLRFLSEIILRTDKYGLERTIWRQLDQRRQLIRDALRGTGLVVPPSSEASQISVEWLDTGALHINDFEATSLLGEIGINVLPGRQFFWNSGGQPESRRYVRLALMKPMPTVRRACDLIRANRGKLANRG